MTYQQEKYQCVNNWQHAVIIDVTMFYFKNCRRKGYNFCHEPIRRIGKRGVVLRGVKRGITLVMNYNRGYAPSFMAAVCRLQSAGGIALGNIIFSLVEGCHRSDR
jgi:hypothetical protein